MSRFFYDAAKQAMLDGPDLLEPEGAVFYRDVERPCRHSRARRLWDRLTGYRHPSTHVVSEPMIRVALVDR